MPTSTDLVTDLPADFEVFGQAVDTSLADLKGGTTGQVLKKNTNADMDFVWAADSAGMTNPMTTTGDTIYSSSGSTPARLGIGSTGQVLTVAGGLPTWATAAAPTFVGCMLYSSTGQVIANNTITAVQFSATDYIDTDGFHDPSTNNTRITIPTGKGGKYLVITGGLWANNPEQIRSMIYVNGSNFTELRDYNAGGRSGPIGHDILTLSAGDYIEFFTIQTSGANNTLWGTTDLSGVKATRFGVEFLGA